MKDQHPSYAILVLLGLYETADIWYCRTYGGKLATVFIKNLQRKTIFDRKEMWIDSLLR